MPSRQTRREIDEQDARERAFLNHFIDPRQWLVVLVVALVSSFALALVMEWLR